MREIKFRAWNKETKQFEDPIYRGVANLSLNDILRGSTLVYQQFTGLKDKNGKEIYEGDVIHGAVVTDEPYTAECPSLDSFHWYQHLEDAIEEGKQITVIGNIYENPELLTNKTQND